MPELKPKKWPRQARSQATFDAIVEASARILDEGGLAAVTTNAIAARAGVAVGSLYEFFPGREAVLAVLADRRLDALRRAVEGAIDEAVDRPRWEGMQLLVERIVEGVAAHRRFYRALMLEAPFLRERRETQRAIDELFGLGPIARRRAGLPGRAGADATIGRMMATAVLDIALTERRAADRRTRARELARLAYRMVIGRDPGP